MLRWHEPMQVARAAFTVGSLTLLSRLTGFARDMLIAAALGAGPVADAFFVSFKLANCLRRLFAEGAFGAGFVPLFTRALADEGHAAAARFARDAASVMLAILLPVLLLAELFMPALVRVLATGFDPGGERYALAVDLSRVTFPYLACVSLAALAGSVLNGIGRFAAAAAAPVLLNLTLIGALLLAAGTALTPVWALAWGVAAAGLLQLLWLLVSTARLGYPLRPGKDPARPPPAPAPGPPPARDRRCRPRAADGAGQQLVRIAPAGRCRGPSLLRRPAGPAPDRPDRRGTGHGPPAGIERRCPCRRQRGRPHRPGPGAGRRPAPDPPGGPGPPAPGRAHHPRPLRARRLHARGHGGDRGRPPGDGDRPAPCHRLSRSWPRPTSPARTPARRSAWQPSASPPISA